MRKAPFTVLFYVSKKGKPRGQDGEKLVTFIRTFPNICEHIKNARRLCITYISVDFIVLLAYYRLSGGDNRIRPNKSTIYTIL